MVVFCCGECGEALKKNQVESHYQRKCRNCNILSCLDCGKDFWGKDYEQHIKCISEEEKYSGKNYVPKPGANKGEVKQQVWVQEVQNAIDKAKTNPKLRNLLERIKPYDNIPRKKAKFENFLKNSLRVNDKYLVSQVWDMLMANTEKPTKAAEASTQNGDNKQTESTEQNGNSDRLVADKSETSEENVKKMSKREKKEERRKKSNKNEKKDKQLNGHNNDCDSEHPKKSKKKRKKSQEESEEDGEEEAICEKEKQGKKRKMADVEGEGEDNSDEDEEVDSPPKKKVFRTKFKWNDVIIEVLKGKGEMKLKKLKRKVLSEYQAQGCTAKSEEKLWAKFDSKLKKLPVVKVLHDKAKLIE